MTVKQFTVDNTTWTPIPAPVACNAVTLRDAAGATSIKYRSTPTDATSEITVAAAAVLDINTGPVGTSRSTYAGNQIVVYAQAASGSPTVVGTFI